MSINCLTDSQATFTVTLLNFTLPVYVSNVVSAFTTKCHLNIRKIALEGKNVELRKEYGLVYMKLRKPYCTATIWSSGKVVVTGATSEENAKIACRRVARILQNLGFAIRFCNFRVVNVLATTQLPFPLKITQFANDHKPQASYEPELHPGVTYPLKDPKATLKIFSTGSLTITAPSINNIKLSLECVCPLLVPYERFTHDDNYIDPKNIKADEEEILKKAAKSSDVRVVLERCPPHTNNTSQQHKNTQSIITSSIPIHNPQTHFNGEISTAKTDDNDKTPNINPLLDFFSNNTSVPSSLYETTKVAQTQHTNFALPDDKMFETGNYYDISINSNAFFSTDSDTTNTIGLNHHDNNIQGPYFTSNETDFSSQAFFGDPLDLLFSRDHPH